MPSSSRLRDIALFIVGSVAVLSICNQVVAPISGGLTFMGYQIHGPGERVVALEKRQDDVFAHVTRELNQLREDVRSNTAVMMRVVEGYQQIRERIDSSRDGELDAWAREKRR